MLLWLSVAPLGKPVVPLVYWMLIASSNWHSGSSTSCVSAGGQRLPLGRAEQHDALELGQVAADGLDHRGVVRGLERRRRDQRAAAGLAQRVLQLGRAVGGVDVDQHDPGLRGRVLDEHPLGAVGAPDPQPVAGRQAVGEQRAGQAVDRLPQLGVRVADVLVAGDERLAVAPALDRAIEVLADGLPQQRRRGGAVDVGWPHFFSFPRQGAYRHGRPHHPPAAGLDPGRRRRPGEGLLRRRARLRGALRRPVRRGHAVGGAGACRARRRRSRSSRGSTRCRPAA